MPTNTPTKKRKRYLLTGLLAIIPLWITFLVLSFLFKTLSAIGEPILKYSAELLGPKFPIIDKFAKMVSESDSLRVKIAMGAIECLIVVAIIYAFGVFTTAVIGKRIFNFFENLLERVPVVKHVYGAVRKLTVVLQEKPANDVERVVLIDFPSPEMKTVGLVTRVMDDATTGRKLAAVYVPTTPNPTSGYLEIVPVDRLTPTDWTMDQAMSFIVSGGAIAPENLSYDRKPITQDDDGGISPIAPPTST